MKILLALIISLSLYGQTLREYKEEVMHDMNNFYTIVKRYDTNDTIGKVVVRSMEIMLTAKNFQQADVVTLMYLTYKYEVASAIMAEIEKKQVQFTKEKL